MQKPQDTTVWLLLTFIEWSFLGHAMYLLGSTLWLASPTLCWVTDGDIICDYVEFAAACAFIFDGLFSLFEFWVVDRYYTPIGGYPHIFGGGAGLTPITRKLEHINWFLLVQLFFFYGALADVMVGSLESFVPDDEETKKYVFGTDLSSAILWNFSGIFGLFIWYFDKKARTHYKSKLQLSMLPCFATSDDLKNHHIWLDVEGWAYWFFFLGNLCYGIGAYACFEHTDYFCWLPETIAASCFIIEWMFMFYDFLRRRRNEEIEELDEQENVKHWLIQNRLAEEIQHFETDIERVGGSLHFSEVDTEEIFQEIRQNMAEDVYLEKRILQFETEGEALWEDMQETIEEAIEQQIGEYEAEGFIIPRELDGMGDSHEALESRESPSSDERLQNHGDGGGGDDEPNYQAMGREPLLRLIINEGT